MKKIEIDSNSTFGFLENQLSNVSKNELALVLIGTTLNENKNAPALKDEFDALNTDLLFASSGSYGSIAEGINLFYWKYYPRYSKPNTFLYPKILIGYADKINGYLKEVKILFGLTDSSPILSKNQIDSFQRHYVESSNEVFSSDIKLAIDDNQHFFGVSKGRESIVKWPFFNHRHGLLFHNYEQQYHTPQTRLKNWDFKNHGENKINKKTRSMPFFIEQSNRGNERSVARSFKAYLQSCLSLFIVFLFNFGKRPDYKIFRFSRNYGGKMNASITKIVDLLTSKTPFAFSHFNDGELTFVKKFKKENHREVWFGRRQNKYTKALGNRLVDALAHKETNYFVGIPCKRCHPKLHKIALNTREKDEYTLPAMTLHHNLAYLPHIINSLRDRKLYFVCNAAQDLSFFENMGLDVNHSRIIHIPFKNSHLEYDVLKEQTFESDSVVLMMCGMLAKILTPHWFENNPASSFITFGSAFDDYIQTKINFNLYPKQLPFSKHIIGTRFFLFGFKRKCPNCFDLRAHIQLNS